MKKIILTPIAFLMFMLFSIGANAVDYSSVSIIASDKLFAELQFDVIKAEGDDNDEDKK